MDLVKEYGGADFLDLRALNVFSQFCFEKGREQGRADEQLRSIESAKEQAKEYRVALEKAKVDGAREFLVWYSGGETMPSFGRYAKCNIDDVIAEWQKTYKQNVE